MHQLEIRDFSRDEWEALSAPCSGRSLVQDWAYGEAKSAEDGWRVERGLLRLGADMMAIFQALVRPLPMISGGLVWINQGPMWPMEVGPAGREAEINSETYGGMLARLRQHYVSDRGMYLRLAPGHALQPDEPLTGYRDAGSSGWASQVLDLARGADDLRAGLKQKWRNCLNKAERLDLDIHSGTDPALFDEFLNLYRGFLAERRFATTVTPSLLTGLQKYLPANRKLMTFTAYQEGAPIASAVFARYGGAAEYLATAGTDAGRKANAGQLLLWRALLEMRKQGLQHFDLGGVDPQMTPSGVLKFKTGMSGASYRLAPEIEAFDGALARLVRWRVRRARAA